MKCDIYKLSQYIDNILNDEDKSSLEKHLSKCKECKEKLEIMRQLNKIIISGKLMKKAEFSNDAIINNVMKNIKSSNTSFNTPAHSPIFNIRKFKIFSGIAIASIVVLLIFNLLLICHIYKQDPNNQFFNSNKNAYEKNIRLFNLIKSTNNKNIQSVTFNDNDVQFLTDFSANSENEYYYLSQAVTPVNGNPIDLNNFIIKNNSESFIKKEILIKGKKLTMVNRIILKVTSDNNILVNVICSINDPVNNNEFFTNTKFQFEDFKSSKSFDINLYGKKFRFLIKVIKRLRDENI